MKQCTFLLAALIFEVMVHSACLVADDSLAHAAETSRLRSWTLVDSVETRYYVDQQNIAAEWHPKGTEHIVFNRSGTAFFYVSKTGDLASDSVLFELRIYETKAVVSAILSGQLHEVDPAGTIRCRSIEDFPAIESARWTAEDDAVIFRAKDGNSPFAVMQWQLSTGKLEKLAESPRPIFGFQKEGDTVAYMSNRPGVPVKVLYPSRAVSDSTVMAGMMGAGVGDSFQVLLYGGKAGNARLLATAPIASGGMSLSPTGELAVAILTEEQPPKEWQRYVGPSQGNWVPAGYLQQFVLFNLISGESKKMLEAPVGPATRAGAGRVFPSAGIYLSLQPQAFWSKDGTHVVLVNVALPLSDSEPDRESMSFIVDYEVSTGRSQVLQPVEVEVGGGEENGSTSREFVSSVRWLRKGESLLISQHRLDGVKGRDIAYRFTGKKWEVTEQNSGLSATHLAKNVIPEISVSITESANTPPSVVATFKDRSLVLQSPQNNLNDVWRAKIEEVEWKEADGRTVKGGLMMPREVKKFGTIPLVIQAYYYLPALFRPDGSHPTGYSAQALVSAGFAVLQIDIPAVDHFEALGTPKENELFVDRIDSAVEFLARSHGIDPTKVGVIGFSRGGYNTLWAVTHPKKTRLKAAVTNDGWAGDFFNYLTSETTLPGMHKEFESMHGGRAFWEDREAWLKNSPSFNASQAQGALLIASSSAEQGAFAYAGLFGSFLLNRKPVELVLFTGGHQLFRPKERYESMKLNVDWMRFWILGEVDENLPERYVRWKRMRNDRPTPQ